MATGPFVLLATVLFVELATVSSVLLAIVLFGKVVGVIENLS